MARLPLLLATSLLVGGQPLVAQDQDYFGAAVAFAGNDLLVVKRAPARGPAAVHLFRETSGGWERRTELRAPGAVERGLALSPTIAAADDILLVGGGDPYGRWGAHAWTRTGPDWSDHPGIALGSEPEGVPAVSLATIMAVLQPRPRTVAMRGQFVALGYDNTVRLFHNGGTVWHEIPVEIPKAPGVAAALAMADSTIFVGSPLEAAGTGAVSIIGRHDSRAVVEATLMPAGLENRSGFGTSLAFDDGILAVGAPGAETVVLYSSSADGWVERQRILPDSVPGFGTALALRGTELLVGAPRSGRVFRYHRVGGTFVAAGELAPPDGADRTSFGTALAIGPNAIAVGAPNAVGGRGRVWVWSRNDTARGTPAELAPAPGPATHASGELRCDNGTAHGFACDNVDLQAFLSIETLGGTPAERVSDIWGWTDPATGREYALLGRTTALVFVDVTDAAAPRIVGEMPANPSGARDIKVYRDHAFLTGDGAGEHGLMVFDLTRLRGATGARRTFEPDAVYRGIASAHNLAIDTASALAIPVAASSGGNTCGGGLHLVDISQPKDPQFAGCFTDTEGLLSPGRTHDVQCVRYHGPDARYAGRSICFASNETALRIVDVTDPANPVPLGRGSYPGAAYIHQGWLTDDHRHFYLDDELDELVGITERTRTMIWDVTDLEDPVMVGTYLGPDNSTDHNLFIKGNRMYQANYQAGLRVVDISDPRAPREIGHFDTTPYQGNAAGFYGAWGVYPYFDSGNVVVTSMQEGLFILKPRPTAVP